MIMDGLIFPRKVAWRLERDFKRENIDELSLKDLVDFLIPEKLTRIPPWEAIPAYMAKEIGIKTHAVLVDHLNQQDLGEAFNTLWRKRLDMLMRYYRFKWGYVPMLLRKYVSSGTLF